jgi:hypothetical protein
VRVHKRLKLCISRCASEGSRGIGQNKNPTTLSQQIVIVEKAE